MYMQLPICYYFIYLDVIPLSTERRGLYLETSTQSRMSAFYYNINGEVIEAEGLKGKLGKLF